MTPGRRLTLLAFLVSIAFYNGILGCATLPKWIVLAVGLPLCRFAPRLTIENLCVGTLLAWCAASIAWTPERFEAVNKLYFFLLFGYAFIAAQEGTLRDIMLGFAAGLCVNAVIGLLQFAGDDLGINQGVAPAGLLFNADFLAEFAAVVSVWIVAVRRWEILPLTALPLALCSSRAAVVVFVAGAIWCLPRWWHRLAAVVAACPAAYLALYHLGSGKARDVNARIEIWRWGMQHLSWRGMGIEWTRAAREVIYLPGMPPRLVGEIHSDVLQIPVELGIIGACLILLLGGLLLWHARHDRIGTAVLVACGADLAVNFPLQLPLSGALLAMVAGTAAAAGHRVQLPRFRRTVAADAGVGPTRAGIGAAG